MLLAKKLLLTPHKKPAFMSCATVSTGPQSRAVVIQVSQLAGYVSEHSAYHHGDVSLTSTIVGMAQNFVGSNNVNLLYPSGTPLYLEQLHHGPSHEFGMSAYAKVGTLRAPSSEPDMCNLPDTLQVSLAPGFKEGRTAPVPDTSSHA